MVPLDFTSSAKVATPATSSMSFSSSREMPITSIATLVSYLRKNKQHRQYASGAREPFVPPSEKGMSDSAACYMNRQAAGDREYLSIEQVNRMPRATPF